MNVPFKCVSFNCSLLFDTFDVEILKFKTTISMIMSIDSSNLFVEHPHCYNLIARNTSNLAISSLVYAPSEDDKILVLKQWEEFQKNNRRILAKLKKLIVPFQNKNETLGKGGGKAPGIGKSKLHLSIYLDFGKGFCPEANDDNLRSNSHESTMPQELRTTFHS
ncbi:hypothetical protein RIR_jg6171.t1 [Rhizophagus irregularis DAOM 181602=DAOM 197198]|nr:hypothetical protein RIR_jg6171.t1 [Rhizophagus irregularis DAOM 181602=DAOM 197198]